MNPYAALDQANDQDQAESAAFDDAFDALDAAMDQLHELGQAEILDAIWGDRVRAGNSLPELLMVRDVAELALARCTA